MINNIVAILEVLDEPCMRRSIDGPLLVKDLALC